MWQHPEVAHVLDPGELVVHLRRDLTLKVSSESVALVQRRHVFTVCFCKPLGRFGLQREQGGEVALLFTDAYGVSDQFE